MNPLFLSPDDIDLAEKHGISVLPHFDADFVKRCRLMGLDPDGVASPPAVMLDCKLRDWVIFIIALLYGGGVVYFTRSTHPLLLLLCLGLMVWLCWYSLSRRQRLIFTDEVLYVGRFRGLWWSVDEIKAEDEAELYGEWIRHQGKALKVRVGGGPWERHILLFPAGSAPDMTLWIAALFLSWKGVETQAPAETGGGERAGTQSKGDVRARLDLRDVGPSRE